MKYNKEILEKEMNNLGYSFFVNGDYNFNVILIRNKSTGNKVTNTFDDLITLSFKENGVWKYYEWSCTTEAGKYYILNPMNLLGTAILVPGQYKQSHTIRKHQNKYDALCQCGYLRVYRDKNKDLIYDKTEIYEDNNFGINIHRSNPKTQSMEVNNWSAGCSVFQKLKDFNLFMSLIKNQKINKYTVTLLEL